MAAQRPVGVQKAFSYEDVAAQVSRYRDKPLHVSTPAVAQMRLSSVFKTNDTDALLKALPQILPVAIMTRADGSQEIIARKIIGHRIQVFRVLRLLQTTATGLH